MTSPGDLPADPVRVFNRSDRVWLFGFVRLIPLVLLFGGIALFLMLKQPLQRLPPEVGGLILFVILVGPIVLDRIPHLNPVNYLGLAHTLQVVRLAGKKSYPPTRLTQLELSGLDGEEYDDQPPAGPRTQVAIRVRRGWTVRLVATREDARRITQWAMVHGIPVVDPVGDEPR